MIDLMILLAKLRHSENGKLADIEKMPRLKKLEDGYQYHESIGIHQFEYHLPGDDSSKSIHIEEII